MHEYLGLTKLDNNLPKIIWMPRQVKEPLVTNLALIHRRPEAELLRVANALHDRTDGVQNHSGDVPARAERRLRVLLDIGRVKDGDGQRDGPDPDHLENPKPEERPEFITLVVEAVVFAGLEDPEE